MGSSSAEQNEARTVVKELGFTDADYNYWCQIFKQKTLIAKIMGRCSYQIGEVAEKFTNLWAKKGGAKITELGNNLYCVMFNDDYEYNRALRKGPWIVGNGYVATEPWKPGFDPWKHKVSHVVVWARVHALPLELFNTTFLHSVGDALGSAICFDHSTLYRYEGRFARIGVRVNLEGYLEPSVRILGRDLMVEYEMLIVCFRCHHYGHIASECKEVLAGKGKGSTE